MEEEVLQSYERAQLIAEKIKEFSAKLLKNGAKVLQLVEDIEEKIFALGAKPAWPVNVCINEVAAHFTPYQEEITLNKEDLVKIDFGVHVNGYISDNAFSVCVGRRNHELIKAAEKALEEACKVVRPGVKVKEISEAISSTLENFGVRTIINLSGHGLERWMQHAPPFIPNVRTSDEKEIREKAIAIEVFTTSGSGWVKESSPANIFQLKQVKPVRMQEARKILELAEKEFEGLPFAKRWIKNVSGAKLDLALAQLEASEALTSYPPLKESYGKVAVAEKTIVVQ